ncbi:hypothetical protein J4408_03960 [Candidatus Pacearchaeota archaeon]|nr:hypothetical protein [Candidatus Pacearchaeota archaeon]
MERDDIYPRENRTGMYIVLPGYEKTDHASKTYIIVLLCLFILFIIVFNSPALIKSVFGIISMIFGYLIIVLTLILRVLKQW